MINDMGEKIAALEHEQWAHWTRYMLDNLTDENIARWKRQIETPYSDLPEKEKDSDRKWAIKVMDIFLEKLKQLNVPNVKACDCCGSTKTVAVGKNYKCGECSYSDVGEDQNNG